MKSSVFAYIYITIFIYYNNYSESAAFLLLIYIINNFIRASKKEAKKTKTFIKKS